MASDIKPIVVTAISDAFERGILTPEGIADHVILCLDLTMKMRGQAGITQAPQPQPKTAAIIAPSSRLTDLVSSQAQAAQKTSMPPGERRIILPDDIGGATQIQDVKEAWSVGELSAYCKNIFPPKLSFVAPGGESLDLYCNLKQIDTPSGLVSGGIQVMYVLSGASEGPRITIWTSEPRGFSRDSFLKDLEQQAAERYRRRGQVNVVTPAPQSFSMDPSMSMYAGDVEAHVK